jgi:hypothetical protein
MTMPDEMPAGFPGLDRFAPKYPGRRMFRYVVPVDDRPHLVLLTSSPVHVANGSTLDEVEFWAEHVSGAPEVARAFQVFGTGHPLPPDARWIGTCPRVSGLVWHLYELVGGEEKPRPAALPSHLGGF